MAYKEVILAATKEEALEKAEAFKESLDIVQGPATIYSPLETPEGRWSITVTYYGFD
jgi:hypothetical protein